MRTRGAQEGRRRAGKRDHRHRHRKARDVREAGGGRFRLPGAGRLQRAANRPPERLRPLPDMTAPARRGPDGGHDGDRSPSHPPRHGSARRWPTGAVYSAVYSAVYRPVHPDPRPPRNASTARRRHAFATPKHRAGRNTVRTEAAYRRAAARPPDPAGPCGAIRLVWPTRKAFATARLSP